MLYYAKIVGLGLFAASILILGWTVKGWADDAGQLKSARAALRDEQKRSIAYQVERNQTQHELAKVSADLADLKYQTNRQRIDAGVKVITKTIHETVKPDPDCDVGEPVAGMLNRARSGDLPEPSALAHGP